MIVIEKNIIDKEEIFSEEGLEMKKMILVFLHINNRILNKEDKDIM